MKCVDSNIQKIDLQRDSDEVNGHHWEQLRCHTRLRNHSKHQSFRNWSKVTYSHPYGGVSLWLFKQAREFNHHQSSSKYKWEHNFIKNIPPIIIPNHVHLITMTSKGIKLCWTDVRLISVMDHLHSLHIQVHVWHFNTVNGLHNPITEFIIMQTTIILMSRT